MSSVREDQLIAEYVRQQKFATDAQIAECVGLAERMRAEMQLKTSLSDVLLKRGYINKAQFTALEQAFDPAGAARRRNVIPGYQLLDRVGVGAMGSVYRANDLQLEIPVAIKILRLALASSPTQIERLKREARLVAKLSHPNIVTSRAVGESAGLHYLVMEFVDGETVRQALRGGPLPEKTALSIARDVALALEHAHAAGIIHRDVKPGNVMRATDGTIKLADFGLARGKAPSDLTLEHASIGTPHYVAPEQMRRASDATERSDLFSLGATIYHMVTGRPPFQGQTLGEIVQNVMACRFDPPEKLRPDLSLDAIFLIHKLMRPDPRERYANARAVVEDIERLERGESIAPNTFRGEYRAHLTAKRWRGALIGVAGLLLAAIPLLWWLNSRGEQREQEKFAKQCQALRATGKNKWDKAKTIPELRATAAAMDKAWLAAETCGGTRELEARRLRVNENLDALDQAAAASREAAEPGKNYRLLRAQARAALQRATLDPVRAAIAVHVDAIVTASARALEKRKTVWEATPIPDRKAARAALAAFAKDVPDAFVDAAGHESLALRNSFSELEAFEKLQRPDYLALETDDNFASWRQRHNIYTKALNERLASSGLSSRYQDLFRDPRLVTAHEAREFEHWKAIEKKVDAALARRDVAAARKALGDYPRRANKYRKEAEEKATAIDQFGKSKSAEQQKRLGAFRITLLQALTRRDYAAAARVGRDAKDALGWTDAVQRDVDVFSAHAQRFGQLAGLLETTRKVPRPWTRKKVEAALASDVPADAWPMAYYLFGESYAAVDPRAGRRGLDEAVSYFRGANRWRLVDERSDELNELLKQREIEAKAVLLDRRRAQERGDYETEHAICMRLLDGSKRYGLAWTDAVEAQRAELQARRDKARRLAEEAIVSRDAGIPVDQFDPDFESSQAELKITFQNWYPDEKSVPPQNADRTVWLEEQRHKYWTRVFAESGLEPGAFAHAYERACHQLRLFSKNLIKRPGQRGATLARARFDQQYLVTGQAPVVSLRHPFRVDTDFYVECTVVWNEEKIVAGRPNIKGEWEREFVPPTFFALGNGRVFGGMFRESDKASGVRLYEGAHPYQDLEKAFAKHAAWGKKIRRRNALREAAPLPGRLAFEKGRALRFRFEVKGDVVSLYGAPVESWKSDGVKPIVQRKLRPQDRAALLSNQFVFTSLVRFTLLDVKMGGRLPK